ncbi:hypothetical protein [Kribbella sp. VKM Ac-2571]|uniref:hypothetical protein n=1 Tax=Kribbella sp. VKM Ac-2571 TaxID=2512222 RepID=UPI001414FD06|nr:hypothetical protein [Kribbella sp. VKM Ac-2571]
MNTLNGLPMHVISVATAAEAPSEAGAAVYDMYRIGDSGAKASWDGKVSSAPYIAG